MYRRHYIRFFVSSTFVDMELERNWLNELFDELRKDYQQRTDWQVEYVDLRWGISDQAGLDNRTMSICKAELQRCQTLSPRPNFIALIGERYGWIPLPELIPNYQGRSIALVSDLFKQYYRRDFNNIGYRAYPSIFHFWNRKPRLDPGPWVLQPFTDTGLDENDRLAYIVEPLADLFKAMASSLKMVGDKESAVIFYSSATEQEIFSGALSVDDADEHVIEYVRMLTNVPEEEKSIYQPNANLNRLDNLKKRLAEKIDKSNTLSVSLSFNDYQTKEYERFFKEEMERHIRKVIDGEIERTAQSEPSLLEREKEVHEGFRSEQTKHFVGRDEECEFVRNFIFEDQNHSLLWIDGEEGIGKSSLLSHAYEMVCSRNANKRDDEEHMNPYYVRCGLTDLTKQAIGVIGLLYAHIRECYECVCDKKCPPVNLETYLNMDSESYYKELIEQLDHLFHIVNDKEILPIVIFIDGVHLVDPDTANDFASFGNLYSVFNFNNDTPIRVKIICSSTLPFYNKWDKQGIQQLTLRNPTMSDAMKIVEARLSAQKRAITDKQKLAVKKALKEERKPMFLTILSNHLARYAYSWTQLDALPIDINSLVILSVETLIRQQHHDSYLVWLALSIISTFKGISDRDLMDVLSMDMRLRQMNEKNSHHKKKTDGLPPIYWYRLSYDLRDIVVYGNAPYGEVNMPAYGYMRDAILAHTSNMNVDETPLLQHAEQLLYDFFVQKWEENNPYALYNLAQLTLRVKGIEEMYKLLYDLRFTSRVVDRFGEYISEVFNVFFSAFSNIYDEEKKATLNRHYKFFELRNWLLERRGCSWKQIMWLATASSDSSVVKLCQMDKTESKGVFTNLLRDALTQDASIFLQPRHKDKPIAVSDNGHKLLYANNEEKALWVYNIESITSSQRWEMPCGFDEHITADDSLERIAVKLDNGRIVVMGTKYGKAIAELDNCENISDLTISHQGNIIAFVRDKSIYLWNFQSEKEPVRKYRFDFEVEMIIFSQSGKTLWGMGRRHKMNGVLIRIITDSFGTPDTWSFNEFLGGYITGLAASDKELIYHSGFMFYAIVENNKCRVREMTFFNSYPDRVLLLRTGRYDNQGHFLISGFGGLCVLDEDRIIDIYNVPLMEWISSNGHYGMTNEGNVYDLKKLSEQSFMLMQFKRTENEEFDFDRCFSTGPNSLSANSTGDWLMCSANGLSEMLLHVLSAKIKNNQCASVKLFIPPYPNKFDCQYVTTASAVSPDGSFGVATSFDDEELFAIVFFNNQLQQTSCFTSKPNKLGFDDKLYENNKIWNIWTEDSQYLVVIIADYKEVSHKTHLILFSAGGKLLRNFQTNVSKVVDTEFTISADNRYAMQWCKGFLLTTIDLENGEVIEPVSDSEPYLSVCSKIFTKSRSGRFVYASLKDNPTMLQRHDTESQDWTPILDHVKNVICTLNDDYVYIHTESDSVFLFDNRNNTVVQKMYSKVSGNMLVNTHNGLAICERFGQVMLLAPSPELNVNRVAFIELVKHWCFEKHLYLDPYAICPHCGKILENLYPNMERTVCEHCSGDLSLHRHPS